MVSDKYSLAAVGRYLIDSFERRRPSLREWSREVDAALRHEAEDEIAQMERQCIELGVSDPKYWQRVRAAAEDILIPRYAKLAQDEIALANREYGIWRGGDLVARAVFALAGFLLGVIAFESPYIPIYVRWFPALTLIAGPFFPDAALWWFHRRYQKKLNGLVADLAKAGESLETYRPLSEVQETLRADLVEGPATGSADEAAHDTKKVRS
jgi:hypothetical protein